MKILVLLGSTRPGRNGEQVAEWVMEQIKDRSDASFEMVDIADFNLPLLDEPAAPMSQNYTKDHTMKWSNKIKEADGYLFVTAEYNHAVPGAFKNAVDYLYHEWNNKAVAFVSYGSAGGTRAVENWRLISAELQLADVREQVRLNMAVDFENWSEFKPREHHVEQLHKTVDQLISWTGAMRTVRSES